MSKCLESGGAGSASPHPNVTERRFSTAVWRDGAHNVMDSRPVPENEFWPTKCAIDLIEQLRNTSTTSQPLLSSCYMHRVFRGTGGLLSYIQTPHAQISRGLTRPGL